MRLPLQTSGPFWAWYFLLSALTQVATSNPSPGAGLDLSRNIILHDGRRSLPQHTEDTPSVSGSWEQEASELSRARALVEAVQREVRSRNAEIMDFAQTALREPLVGSGSPYRGWSTPAIPVIHINKTVADAAALVSESLARTSSATAAAPLLMKRQQRSAYWMEEMDQNGRSPFVADSDYKVWRNVRDYGARGDGVRDDTEAIMRAVRDGNRCGKECGSSSTLQAIVYFPSGTYLVSSSIVQYYLTQFIGDATDPPTIKASPAFVGLGVISTNVYDEADGGKTWYVVQSNFFRQVRNFVMDISEAPRDQNVAAIHWQVGQATSLENIKFKMSTSPGNNQQGIFMESGSGGFLSNLEFDGGAVGAYVGNQQFTVRGLSFSNHQVAAIHIHWSWGWTWKSVEISRCPVGVLMVTPNAAPGVGSAIFLDSAISDTNVGFRLQDPADDARITLSLFNLNTSNVPVVVEYTSGRVLLPGSGGEASVTAWGVGKRYDAADAGEAGGVWQDGEAYARVPAITESLLKSPGHNRSGFFERSKPQYATRRAVDFLNVKKFPFNAAGDGTRDDTFALNLALVFATASGMIVWIPAGVYRVTDTVHIPRGAKVVGQSWSQIMGTGEKFQDAEKPRAVVRVGNIGDVGDVEIQDLVFTVRGPAAGAVLLQWNIHEQSPGSAAMWDTHIRVGGQAGSNLQARDCPKNTGSVNPDCVAAALLVHITSEASAYFENAWFWVADHDLDIPEQTQIDVYVARGVLVESIGPVWLYGTGSEHCVLYQYQTVNAANIFMGMIQSESPYFQPVPRAPAPFAAPSANFSSDPRFGYCADVSAGCAVSWGLRFINSNAVYLYGAGVYSFFSGYDQACVEREDCQDRIIEVETSSDVWMFSLVTKAAVEMISPRGGVSVKGADNKFNFCSIVMAWLGSASQRRGLSGVRYGSPRSATVVEFLSTTLAPTATLTISGPVLSHLSTAVNDGFQNRPPGPGADLCRNCDLLRLLTSTCCGTGGNTSNPVEISPDIPLPRALVLPPGFVVNQPVRDNRGRRYPAGQPLPVEVIVSGGTMFPFPLVIEPGVGLTNITSLLDDEEDNDNSTLFIVRDFWERPDHTVSCIIFPCVINFPPVTTTSTWILPPLTTTINGEERSTTIPPVTTHVIRISKATVDVDDSSNPTIVPVPVPKPVCVEMNIPLLGPLPIGVCPPAIEPVPSVPIVTVVPVPPGTLPGPVIPGNKPTTEEEDPEEEEEEEDDEEEEEVCFWSGIDEPKELDFSGGEGGPGGVNEGSSSAGAGTGRPTTSTRTVTPRPTTSRVTPSTVPEEPVPPPTEPPPEPTQEPPKPDRNTEESTCFESGRQVFGGTVQDALNNFCDWADGQTIEKNGFLQASEPGDLLSGVAVGVVGKNNCKFRIEAADCKKILNKVVGCRPGGSLLRIGGKVESNCATWTLDPYQDLKGDCFPIPGFTLLCEFLEFFAP